MGWLEDITGGIGDITGMVGGGQNAVLLAIMTMMSQLMNKQNKDELGNPLQEGLLKSREQQKLLWNRTKQADTGETNNPAVRKMRELAQARAGTSGLTAQGITPPDRYSPADTGPNVFNQQTAQPADRYSDVGTEVTVSKPEAGIPGRYTDTGAVVSLASGGVQPTRYTDTGAPISLAPKGATPARTQYTPGTPYQAQQANAPGRFDPYTPNPAIQGSGGTPNFTPNLGTAPKRFDPYTPNPAFPGTGGFAGGTAPRAAPPQRFDPYKPQPQAQPPIPHPAFESGLEQGAYAQPPSLGGGGQAQPIDPMLMMKMLAMAQGGQTPGQDFGMQNLMNSLANRFGARDMRQGNVSGQLNPVQLPTGINPLYANLRGV